MTEWRGPLAIGQSACGRQTLAHGVSRGFTVRKGVQPRQGRQKAADRLSGKSCTKCLTPLTGLSRGAALTPRLTPWATFFRPTGCEKASTLRHSARIPSHTRRDTGTVLIVAMWVVLVLAGLVLVFARAMRVEAAASANAVASLQAEAIARGALRYVLDYVEQGMTDSEDVDCQAVEVGSGCFWLLRPDPDDDQTYRFGIDDESAKVSLNSATQDMLLKLPGMTAELAAAIIDWRDGDSDVSSGGAEREYYLLLDDPYDCKNGPFESVDELLLVKGASVDILAGEDANRNGVLDPNENDASDSEPADNRDGKLDGGLYDYVTVYSRQPNTTESGGRRINVNSMSTRELSTQLRSVVPDDRYFQLMDKVRSGRPFTNIIHFYLSVGLTIEEFKKIADKLTTSNARNLEGLINVNTAPRRVLLCLPELDESDVDALLAKRTETGTDLTTIAWVAEALPADKAIAIGGAITTTSRQYSADIVALSGDGRAWKRYRAVIDTRESPMRVVFWKDLTHLGWPLDPAILKAVRAGRTPDDAEPAG